MENQKWNFNFSLFPAEKLTNCSYHVEKYLSLVTPSCRKREDCRVMAVTLLEVFEGHLWTISVFEKILFIKKLRPAENWI